MPSDQRPVVRKQTLLSVFIELNRENPSNAFILRPSDNKLWLHWANTAMESIMGKVLKETEGLTLTEILGDCAQKLEENYQKCLSSGKPIEYQEVTRETNGSQRLWHTLLIPIPLGSKGKVEYVAAQSSNITNVKSLLEFNQSPQNTKEDSSKFSPFENDAQLLSSFRQCCERWLLFCYHQHESIAGIMTGLEAICCIFRNYRHDNSLNSDLDLIKIYGKLLGKTLFGNDAALSINQPLPDQMN